MMLNNYTCSRFSFLCNDDTLSPSKFWALLANFHLHSICNLNVMDIVQSCKEYCMEVSYTFFFGTFYFKG